MIKPVLLIGFNRPDTIAKVLDTIRQVAPKELFIACDGPRPDKPGDVEKCEQVKTVLEKIDWDCQVHKLYQIENLGCSKAPITAINWFFSNVEEGIILEDDCLPTKEFFFYCTELLNYYKDNNAIINICGSNMGDNRKDESGYFFSRFMNMSGWATWRRSVKEIDYDLAIWRNSKRSLFGTYKMLRQNIFDTDIHWYKYWKEKFEKTITEENISWWDWQWIFFQLKNKRLSIIPNQNLVSNIGFNANASHTKDPHNPLSNIPASKLSFPLTHPLVIKPDFDYEEHFVKWVWCYHKRLSRLFYIKYYISRFLRRNAHAY